MKAIQPIDTLCEKVLYSNVPIDYPVWLVGTTYSKGALVVGDACASTVYESLVNSNLGNDPETNPLDWLEVGVSNYWAMFDQKDSSQTVRNESIIVEVEFDTVVDAIALMNIDALEVRFEAWRGINETKVLDVTFSLSENVVFDWYSYFYAGFNEVKNFVSFALPTIRNGRGRMTLTGGEVKIGSLIYGQAFALGVTVLPFELGIKDFSTKEQDAFGNFIIVERAYNLEMSANVIVDNVRVGAVQNFLAFNRAKPLVWSAGDDGTSNEIIYGFYQDGIIQKNHSAYSELPIKIIGVTA